MSKAEADRDAVARRLRSAREGAGLTQGQAAKALGVHRPAVSEIEAGRRRVAAEELARLAELYGVSVSWLASGESEWRDEAAELAARELRKLKPQDLETLLRLLRTLRQVGDNA